MDFDFYLKKQIELHPSMQMQDLVKMCYQAVFGMEHMLSDIEKAREYFFLEYNDTPADPCIPLYEPISENFCRVNLAAWKSRNFSPEELFKLFIDSAKYSVPGTRTDLNNCAKAAEKLIRKGLLNFSLEEWKEYYVAYKNNGMHPVHHSDAYRQAERPAYRLIQKSLLHADIT